MIATKIKEYDNVDEETESFGTIAQIQLWMLDNGIPHDAVVRYSGCGTHRISFVWKEEVKDDLHLEGTT